MKRKMIDGSTVDDVETNKDESSVERKKKKREDLKRRNNSIDVENEHDSVSPVKKKEKAVKVIGHESDENHLNIGLENKQKHKHDIVYGDSNEVVVNEEETIDCQPRKNSQELRNKQHHLKSTKAALTMLDRMSEILNNANNQHDADYKETLASFDWQQVCFDTYTADDCKRCWKSVYKQIRKYRTLAELVNDAKNLKDSSLHLFARPCKPRDMPKRPTCPLFLFYQKKLKSFCRKHPGMTSRNATPILAQKFASLSPAKKQKYLDQYAEAKKLYDIEMAKYSADHPHSQTSSPALKNMSAAKFYVEQKCQEKLSQADGKGNKRKWIAKYQRRWKSLTDEQKLEFINTAMQDNSEDGLTTKPHIVLSKQEQQLKDRAEGKLQKPPMSGYVVFVRKFCSKTDAGSKKDLQIAAREAWKNLPDKKKKHYSKKAKKAQDEYAKQNPQDHLHQRRVEKPPKPPKRPRQTVQLFDGEPIKPLNAYTMFMKSKMSEIDKDLHQRERMVEASRMWSELSAEDKQYWQEKSLKALHKYQKALERFKQNLSEEDLLRYQCRQRHTPLARTPLARAVTKTTKKSKRVPFEGEPKKPP